MLTVLKKFFSPLYINLLLRSKISFLRSKIISLDGYKFVYPNWPQFYGLVFEIFIGKIYKIDDVISCKNIIDAGANIGLATAYFHSKYPLAHITCFEPNLEAHEFLKQNISQNKISATIYPFALGNDEKEVPFYIDTNVLGATSAGVKDLLSNKNRQVKVIRLPMRKLSSFISGEIDILKLDIEGGEWDVLENLIETKKLQFIKHLLIEFHFHPENLKRSLAEFLAMLEKEGYFYYVSRRDSRNISRKIVHSYNIYAFQDKKI